MKNLHTRTSVVAALGATALAASLAGYAAPSGATEVIRHKVPGANLPYVAAIEVPADARRVILSGNVAPLIDKTVPATDPAAYGGDTKAQAMATLKSIESQLAKLGLGMKDIVKMNVYLVGVPAKGGKMDFAGFSEAYSKFFGTPAQPMLPTRATLQVAGLVNPAYLVEIEVEAVGTAP